MPLKKSTQKLTQNPNPVDEGNIIQTFDGQVMNLFDSAKLPAVTLHADQFKWPEKFLVRSFKRVQMPEKGENGWTKKDSNGNKVMTDKFMLRCELSDGDSAETLIDAGSTIDGLTTITCEIRNDVSTNSFENDSTLLELVHPVLMLGMGSMNSVDRLVIVAEDCKEV